MTTFKRPQLLLILAGVLVAIGIALAPRSKSKEAEKIKSQNEEAATNPQDEEGKPHSVSEKEWKNKLNSRQSRYIDSLEEKAIQIADLDTKLSLYDSLIQFSLKQNIPPLVAKYTEKKAQSVSTETNWMLAGDRYFKAFRLSKNQSKSLIDKAISSYEMVLELNQSNLDAQTAIGVAYVEGASVLGEMPMKGIGILKEVLNKDPENINALTNLGYFAIQSGQFEKAIERFNKVLSIEPKNAEAFLYLTDAYLSQGDEKKGLETLRRYKSLLDDPHLISQVDQYIEEIKSN